MIFTVWPKRSAISLFTKVFVGSFVVLLAGCVKPTKFPRYLTVADVIDNIKCQLYAAVNVQAGTELTGKSFANSGHWLTSWTAEFTLNLKVARKGELSGDTSFVTPYTLGTFTNKLSAGLSKQATSNLTLDFRAENNLLTFMNMYKCKNERVTRRKRNLAGETGLSLWFGKLIEGIDDAKINETASKFAYSIEFILSANGSFIPSYSFTYPSLRKLFGMAKLAKSRSDTNKLTVTFAPYVPPKNDPNKLDTELKALQRIVEVLGTHGKRNDKHLRELIKLTSEGRPLTQIQGLLDKDKALGKKDKLTSESRDPKKESKELTTTQDIFDRAISDAQSAQAAERGKGPGDVSEQTQQSHDNLRIREAIRDIR